MTQAVPIRTAIPDDAGEILRCLAEAFAHHRASYTDGAWIDTVLTPASLRQRFDEMTILVALDEAQRVIGTVAYKLEHAGEAHLRGMAVLPTAHGRGVAQALLDRAEADLRRLGCRRITLDTTQPLQRAIHFYEKNGFRATGEISEFFGMDLFAYSKDLG